MMKREYYFAYGSNMDEDQMKIRCPNAVRVGKGLVFCYRFAIDSAGLATIIHDNVNRDPFPYVEGVVWAVNESDIQNLDAYEGIEHHSYRKQYIDIFIKTKKETICEEVLVYISNRPEWSESSGTGSRYMDNIFENAFLNNFTDDYLDVLYRYTERIAIPVSRGSVLDRYLTRIRKKQSSSSGNGTIEPSEVSSTSSFEIRRTLPIKDRPSAK